MSSRKSNHFAGDPIVAAYEQLQEELRGKDDGESAIERKDKEDQGKEDSDESGKDDEKSKKDDESDKDDE